MKANKSLLISALLFSASSYAIYPPGCVVGKSTTGLTAEAPLHVGIGISTQYKGDYSYSIRPLII